MHLLEKLLPLQVNGAGLAGSTIGTVNVVSVPENHFLSAADIERVRAGLPYEHVPEPVQSALEPSNQPERMEEPVVEQALLEPPEREQEPIEPEPEPVTMFSRAALRPPRKPSWDLT